MLPNEIKFLCQQYGIKPSKAKGQNFLINQNIIPRMIAAANLKASDCVLEIGPGFGILTEALLAKCQKILAVELDKNLLLFLRKKFADRKKLQLVSQDILKIKNDQIVKLFQPKADQPLAENCYDEGYKVVANLPYAITKPLLKKFLTYSPKPKEITVLVQKEVAEKITAKPGKMSLLSLSVQLYGQPEIIGIVDRSNFYPQPRVDSAILKIKLWPQFFAPEIKNFFGAYSKFNEKKFWQLAKIGYSSPRKQLQNNLAAGFLLNKEDVKNCLNKAELGEKVRAEDLALIDWLRLYGQLVV